MKKILLACIFVLVFSPPATVPTAQCTFSNAERCAESFTENVLPIDVTQYNVTLEGYYVSNPPDIKGGWLNNHKEERIRYSLISETSQLTVSYKIENDVLTTCIISVDKGSTVIADQPYNTLNDAIRGFLERYQTYRHIDASKMILMASTADMAKNQTLLLDDLKLKIANTDSPGGHITQLMWYKSINGCDYLELSVGYTDGVFTSCKDTREVYPIGNTAVNISSEQAIAAALKYIQQNYTYEMWGDVWVRDFNVVEDEITAVLASTVFNSSSQYPVYSIRCPLDHTYPGSVVALLVIVSADSGVVLSCANQATGGGNVISASEEETIVLPSQSPLASPLPSPSSSSVALEPTNNNTVTIMGAAVAIAAVVVASALVFFKRRK